MEQATRRPLIAIATFATAGALTLAPITAPPAHLHAPSASAAHLSTQEVRLTDVWSDLASDTVASVVTLGAMFFGADPMYPLPSPTIPFTPIVTQLVLNQFIYAAQLLMGSGSQIPGEISNHLTAVTNTAGLVISAVGPLLGQYLKLPFVAAQAAVEYVTTATNPLLALLEAPAVFLNLVLNNQYGLLGQVGPIGFPILVRNIVAKGLYTAPPMIVLPFKKPSAAAVAPKSIASERDSLKPTTASSARSKPKAPSSAASSKRKPAASAKAANSAGRGHSKRG